MMIVSILMHMFSGAPWVPSSKRTIELMLKEARLKKGETIFDLGCGDARLLIRAEKKYGTHGIGYEHAPFAYFFAHLYKILSRSKVILRCKNLLNAPLQETDVIFLYLGPDLSKKLAPKIKKECKPGTRIICNTFHLPGMEPERKIPKSKTHNTVYLYKV